MFESEQAQILNYLRENELDYRCRIMTIPEWERVHNKRWTKHAPPSVAGGSVPLLVIEGPVATKMTRKQRVGLGALVLLAFPILKPIVSIASVPKGGKKKVVVIHYKPAKSRRKTLSQRSRERGLVRR